MLKSPIRKLSKISHAALILTLAFFVAVAWVLIFPVLVHTVFATTDGSNADLFVAELSSLEEHPSFDSAVQGNAEIEFDSDLTNAEYNLIIENGEALTQAFLQCGYQGQNGPAVSSMKIGRPGILTDKDMLGILCGGVLINSISDLHQAVNQGMMYVNVYSEDHPAGLVRGQF